MLETLVSVFTKETAKALLKAVLFKDGRLSVKRAITIAALFAIGWIVWQLPIWFLDLPFTSRFIRIVFPIIDHPAHLEVVRVALLLVYVILLLFASAIKLHAGQIELAGLVERDRKVIEFAKHVDLVYGNRCVRNEERHEAEERIANEIVQSEATRIMAINAYHDLVSPDSVIRRALEQKGRNLRLQVLLLDPFSEYATERASQLKQETDPTRTRYRYIRDHVKVIQAVKALEKKAALAEFRIYCSKPFFRFYLFDHDFYVQTYQSRQHGNRTALFNFSNGAESLYCLGKEMFEYYWFKGFVHSEESLINMGSPLTLYLARMYGLVKSEDEKVDCTNLRQRILQFVESELVKVDELDKSGVLTNRDH